MQWTELTPHLTGLAHLATASADGQPHVSVVMPYIEGSTLWVFTRASSGKAQRVRDNGRVALTWRPGPEAYLWGAAEVVSDVDERARLWAFPDLPFDPAGFFGTHDHPDHVLLRITPERATLMLHDESGFRRLTWRG